MQGTAQQLIGKLDARELVSLARSHKLVLRTGPFKVRLHSDDREAVHRLQQLYRYHCLADPADLAHFHISLQRPRGLRRWWHPQVIMRSDSQTPFEPFRLDHAFPLFEWSFNWAIAMQAHQYLLLHAAVVEKHGLAMLMPALPGSGKSTLCAALMLRGWRLLSDEFGVIRPDDAAMRLHPLPRPIPLKNESIELIRRFSPHAELGPTYTKTRKGDVAHLMASEASQRQGDLPAQAGWLLFPRYRAGSDLHLEQMGAGRTFLKISGNSFNYKLQGARGFRAVSALVKRCPAQVMQYSNLDQAIAQIERQHEQVLSRHPGAEEPAAQ